MRLLTVASLLLVASAACQRVVGIGETRVSPPSPGPTGTKDAGARPPPSTTDPPAGPVGPDASLTPIDGGASAEDAGEAGTVDAGPQGPAPDAADDQSAPPPDVNPTSLDVGPGPPPACPAPTADAQVDSFTPQNSANCGFGGYRPTATYAAAVDNAVYAGALACGACIELSNARGKVVAQVVERNLTPPVGGRNKISVNRAALDMLGGGVIAQAKWRWVPCPVSGSIRAALKENNPFFLELIVLDFTNRLAKVEFRTSGNRAWREARRQEYNYFLHREPGGLPSELRLTDVLGNQVVSKENLRWTGTSFISLDAQFPAQCSP